MDQPHAPLRVMPAVGDFRITQDTRRAKEVSFCLAPRYATQARPIFGQTPQLPEFFS